MCSSDLLKGVARKAWRFWAAELEGMSLNCRPDAMMLEGCCVSYQTYVELYELIRDAGQTGCQEVGSSGINWRSDKHGVKARPTEGLTPTTEK